MCHVIYLGMRGYRKKMSLLKISRFPDFIRRFPDFLQRFPDFFKVRKYERCGSLNPRLLGVRKVINVLSLYRKVISHPYCCAELSRSESVMYLCKIKLSDFFLHLGFSRKNSYIVC